MRRSFGFASKNFYPEFLAVVDIMDSLEHYFPQIKPSRVYAFKEVVLQKPVNVRRLAKDLNIDLSELRRLNPS
ncbi:MAG: hypothetical protein GWN00_28640, partial [Aliifodinibius sp.]|nr:hypothetical protein [Fodinibius sp.]NIV14731.1 hypothetical protein [Fodinibius sp.]NIY28626.1 hypothetical protein [Fodinibius sp.]